MTPKKRRETDVARLILQCAGHRQAAEYLRQRGWTLEGARWLLLRYRSLA